MNKFIMKLFSFWLFNKEFFKTNAPTESNDFESVFVKIKVK